MAEDTKKVTRNLFCKLTDEEVLAYSRSVASKLGEKDREDKHKKRAAKEFDSRIANLESEVVDLIEKVNTGEEMREVECEWRYEWTSNTKVLVRLDTGEEIDKRPIEADERQATLPEEKGEEETEEPTD